MPWQHSQVNIIPSRSSPFMITTGRLYADVFEGESSSCSFVPLAFIRTVTNEKGWVFREYLSFKSTSHRHLPSFNNLAELFTYFSAIDIARG